MQEQALPDYIVRQVVAILTTGSPATALQSKIQAEFEEEAKKEEANIEPLFFTEGKVD